MSDEDRKFNEFIKLVSDPSFLESSLLEIDNSAKDLPETAKTLLQNFFKRKNLKHEAVNDVEMKREPSETVKKTETEFSGNDSNEDSFMEIMNKSQTSSNDDITEVNDEENLETMENLLNPSLKVDETEIVNDDTNEDSFMETTNKSQTSVNDDVTEVNDEENLETMENLLNPSLKADETEIVNNDEKESSERTNKFLKRKSDKFEADKTKLVINSSKMDQELLQPHLKRMKEIQAEVINRGREESNSSEVPKKRLIDMIFERKSTEINRVPLKEKTIKQVLNEAIIRPCNSSNSSNCMSETFHFDGKRGSFLTKTMEAYRIEQQRNQDEEDDYVATWKKKKAEEEARVKLQLFNFDDSTGKSKINKFDIDGVVRELIRRHTIEPGVNVLTYVDSNIVTHQASLLPNGQVQDSRTGLLFKNFRLWIKDLNCLPIRSRRSIETEIRRIEYKEIRIWQLSNLLDTNENGGPIIEEIQVVGEATI